MLWSSEIWQNSAYKRNTKYSVLYAGGYKRKKVYSGMKYSWKAIPRDEKQLMKNESKIIFRCLVRSVVKMQ